MFRIKSKGRNNLRPYITHKMRNKPLLLHLVTTLISASTVSIRRDDVSGVPNNITSMLQLSRRSKSNALSDKFIASIHGVELPEHKAKAQTGPWYTQEPILQCGLDWQKRVQHARKFDPFNKGRAVKVAQCLAKLSVSKFKKVSKDSLGRKCLGQHLFPKSDAQFLTCIKDRSIFAKRCPNNFETNRLPDLIKNAESFPKTILCIHKALRRIFGLDMSMFNMRFTSVTLLNTCLTANPNESTGKKTLDDKIIKQLQFLITENCRISVLEQIAKCKNNQNLLDHGSCGRVLCTCHNGIAWGLNTSQNSLAYDSDTGCTYIGQIKCEKCHAGWHGEKCDQKNVCMCEYGKVDGKFCENHGNFKCGNCHRGYFKKILRYHEDGPDMDNNGHSDGQNQYGYYDKRFGVPDKGYKYDQITCEKRECFCQGGKAVKPEFCPLEKGEFCKSCTGRRREFGKVTLDDGQRVCRRRENKKG